MMALFHNNWIIISVWVSSTDSVCLSGSPQEVRVRQIKDSLMDQVFRLKRGSHPVQTFYRMFSH